MIGGRRLGRLPAVCFRRQLARVSLSNVVTRSASRSPRPARRYRSATASPPAQRSEGRRRDMRSTNSRAIRAGAEQGGCSLLIDMAPGLSAPRASRLLPKRADRRTRGRNWGMPDTERDLRGVRERAAGASERHRARMRAAWRLKTAPAGVRMCNSSALRLRTPHELLLSPTRRIVQDLKDATLR